LNQCICLSLYRILDARSLARTDITLLIIGNKSDSKDRIVTFLEGSMLAQENNCMFLETSAMTGDNIFEAFSLIANSLIFRVENGELDPSTMLPTGISANQNQNVGEDEACSC
jgi:Ras-related protein Rab-8A